MTGVDIVKKAPNSVVIVCATTIIVAVLGSLTFLAYSGKDAAEISRFINTGLNFLMLLIGGVGAVAAGSAAVTAKEAKEAAEQARDQTNGPLTERFDSVEQSLARLTPESPAQITSREKRDE